MDSNIIKQAVLGTPDAWTLLLKAGAESLLDDVRFEPEQAELTADDFCKEEDAEAFSKSEMDLTFDLLRYSGNSYPCVALLARQNKRIPDERVVRFMFETRDFAHGSRASDRATRSTYWNYARLCGSVGRWLAGFDAFRQDLSLNLPVLFNLESIDPEAAKDEALRLWQSDKSAKDRAEALKALRRLAPDEAREALDGVFTMEKPGARAAFLDAMTVNLGESDAPFLEKALDDKSADCKKTALLLLCKIPTTTYATAMRKRAEIVASGNVPAYDADCKIARFPEEDQKLAFSVVQAVPLKSWTEKLRLTPRQLVERYPFGPQTEALYFGWAQSFLNDVYDKSRKMELDDPQVVLDAYPCAFEWLDVFFDFWEKFDGLSAKERVRLEKNVPPNFIVNWKLSLTFCDPHTVSKRKLIAKTGFKSDLGGALGIDCEPRPFSEEFMRAYMDRLARKNKLSYYDAALFPPPLIYFEPRWRKEVVQAASDPRLQQYFPQIPAMYDAAEHFVARFGEYSDPPLKRPADA